MLGFSAAAQFMSAPGQSYSVAAFNRPMQESIGISETELSYAYGAATIFSGIALPWIGRLVDQFGARKVLPVVAGLLGIACVVMSQVSSQPMLYVGFALIRCLGQGAMWLIGAWIVGEWFLKKRGFATADFGLGEQPFGDHVPPFESLSNYAEFGWRTAWLVLGAMVAATMILPVALFFRDRPEDLGSVARWSHARRDARRSRRIVRSDTKGPRPHLQKMLGRSRKFCVMRRSGNCLVSV